MKPVIATPVGGIPEVIDNNINGILVGAGQISSLAHAMIRLMMEEGLAGTMGKSALEKIKNNFVDSERVLDLMNLLKTLVPEKGSVLMPDSRVK
jgi:glycosyltransferase involved in cell wall biosynthesis